MDTQPAMSMADGSIGNVQGQSLTPEAIDAAKKVIQQTYTKHAQDVAAIPGGLDVLHHLVNTYGVGGLNNNPQIQPASSPISSAKITSDGNIQNSGALGGIFGMNTNTLIDNLVKLSNVQNNVSQSNTQGAETGAIKQKINAGQPSEIALPQAQIGLLQSQKKQIQQQMAGLTPEQQASAIGNYNTALISQHNDLQKGITDQITSTATAIDQLVKNTPLLNKAPGSPYYDTLTALQNRLQGLTNQGKDVVGKFKDLELKNPNQKSNSGVQQFNIGGITYNIPTNKVAAFKKAKGL